MSEKTPSAKLQKKATIKHSKIENVQIFGVRANFAPAALIVMAEHFYDAALVVRKARPEGQRWSPSERFLACRSIELGLKAFLALKGRALTELSGGIYGHDLQNLMTQADADGLAQMVVLTVDERSLIDFVHRYYLDKIFEYPAVGEAICGYPGDPGSVEPLLSAGRKLIEQLRDPCSRYGAASGPSTIVIEAGRPKE
jgi:hypothetical protein